MGMGAAPAAKGRKEMKEKTEIFDLHVPLKVLLIAMLMLAGSIVIAELAISAIFYAIDMASHGTSAPLGHKG